MAEISIFDNYDVLNDEALAEARRFLMEEYGHATDAEVEQMVFEDNQEDWDTESARLEDFMDGKAFIVNGTVGRWNGTHAGGKIVHSFRELSGAWQDCDFVRLYDLDGEFCIQCTHHDGTNSFIMRELTEAGEEFMEGEPLNSIVAAVLMDDKYSRPLNYAEKAYGCGTIAA